MQCTKSCLAAAIMHENQVTNNYYITENIRGNILDVASVSIKNHYNE